MNLPKAMALAALAAGLSACLSVPSNPSFATATGQSSPVTPSPRHPVTSAEAPWPTPLPAPTPPAFTLEQKIGQLLLVGLDGQEVSRQARYLITSLYVGGIVLRSRNVVQAAQVARLTAGLQSAAAERDLPPLFIAVDQEGGDVARLRDGVTRFPAAMALGAAHDPDLAYHVGYATAAELLPLGLNVNLAPVLDVLGNADNLVIGTRAFGTELDLVAELGPAYLRGALDAGIVPVVKHYPGHGDTHLDSHAGLPAIEVLDTAPFDAAIAQGAPVVMVGHLWARPLDSQPIPASLSPAVIAHLRQTFSGVILTDSLNMGAVTSFYSIPEAAVQSLRAGADWLMVAEPADVPGVVAAIRGAIARSDLAEARLDEALARVWALKSRLPSSVAPLPDSAAAANAALAAEAARRSIALGGPPAGQLPWSPSLGRILLLAPNSLAPADAGDDHYTYLAQLIAARGPRVTELLYALADASRNADYAAQAALYASASDAVLFGAWDAAARRDTVQRDALTQARRSGKPIVVVGLHTPFDLEYLSGVQTYLAAFGPARPQMEALVGALFGDFAATGVMPTINP